MSKTHLENRQDRDKLLRQKCTTQAVQNMRMHNFKGMFSQFIHLHVVSNLYEFIYSVKHKISSFVQQKKDTHVGLEQVEGE